MRRILPFLSLIFASLFVVACTGNQQTFGVGAEAPAFSLPSAEGEEVTLADYEDTPVLLFFHMAMG